MSVSGGRSRAMSRRPLISMLHSLSSRESRRRLWHITPGLLAFPLQFISHADPLSPTLRGIILAVICVLAAQIYLGFRRIQREQRENGLWAVAGYALSVLGTVVLFPDRLEVSLALLAILAFGDGSATAFGKMLRGPALPWNHGKTWAGFLAFIINGSLMAGCIYWGETQNPEALEAPLSMGRALALTVPAVVLCAIVESVPSKINDNVRVGLVGSVSLLLLSCLR